MRTALAVLLVVGSATTVWAQDTWTYRVRFQGEHTGTRSNERNPIRQPSQWDATQLFILSGDSTWIPHERFRVTTAGSALAAGSGDVDGVLREGYVRTGVASWLDVEAGKRVVRWGVGYGYAPAGVLDPPRNAADPTDRLQLNSGQTMLKADVYRGESTLSVAATTDVLAGRLGQLLPGGLELVVIAAADRDAAPRYAVTGTYVIGQQLEVHGEVLSHADDGSRTASASAGLQYTFTAGINVVVEYHRNGRGLTDAQWDAVMRGEGRPRSVVRRNSLFFRAARAGNDLMISPELIAIANADDGSWTLVPAFAWTPQRHLQVYLRMTTLLGGDRSIAGFAPTSGTVTFGGVVRF